MSYFFAACGGASTTAETVTREPDAHAVDTDGDGLADEADLCPRDPEQWNGIQDEDGCPDRPHDPVVPGPVVIRDLVGFEPGAPRLAPQSDAILDAVAATVLGNPGLGVLEIHAFGAAGGDLGRRRAEAVRGALILRNVPAIRLRIVDSDEDDGCPSTDAARPGEELGVRFAVLHEGRRLPADPCGAAR